MKHMLCSTVLSTVVFLATAAQAQSTQVLKDWPLCSNTTEAYRLAIAWAYDYKKAWELLKAQTELAEQKDYQTVELFPKCDVVFDRPREPGIKVNLVEQSKLTVQRGSKAVSVISAAHENGLGTRHAYTIITRKE